MTEAILITWQPVTYWSVGTGARRCFRVGDMPRGPSDIPNTAIRIFLQQIGAAYDEERGFTPFRANRDFDEVREFFGDRCCYCGIIFGPGRRAVQDHLVPMNKADLGLHAWGNIVPACDACNAKKQGGDWRDFIVQRAGVDAAERHTRVKAFLKEYRYEPSRELGQIAGELYEEIGAISSALIRAKIDRVRRRL